MQLPIGYDNFSKIVEKNLNFVDKTLFIQEILDDKAIEVLVFTRPRRFGKTLNLSMLQYFFAAHAYGRTTRGLFDGLKIAALDSYMQHQGKYPVIFLTLKEVRDHGFSTALEKLGELMRRTYREHSYVLEGNVLSSEEKVLYHAILAKQANQTDLEASLYNLTEYLSRYTGQKTWVLIDEYDTPIQSAFLHGYFQEMVSLLRGLFGAVLKTNPYLEKAVITGILRIAKENLFSGLNNVKVYTLLDSKYGEYFGFTEEEMKALLIRANLTEQADAIRHWYNGYLAGNVVIYNPWSIANCMNDNGALCPYWVNTSSNDLVKHLLARGDVALKKNLALLLADKPIEALIDENMVFGDVEKDNNALWNLLLFSGYLKAVTCESFRSRMQCSLTPPNYEVKILYESIMQGWFLETLGYDNYKNFLESLTQGDVTTFTSPLARLPTRYLQYFRCNGASSRKILSRVCVGFDG